MTDRVWRGVGRIFAPCLSSFVAAGLGLGLAGSALAEPYVELQTSEGRIVLELHPRSAPQTVANFLAYVDAGFYAGTVVHRVIPGFMVQGGGYDQQLQYRPTREPIDNETPACLKNRRGTVAMARSMAPRSTTSQFFINVEDNNHLNHVRAEPGYEGYCAFATVVEGMDVADRMSKLPTGPGGMFPADVPLEPVVIAGAQRVDGPVRFSLDATSPDAPNTLENKPKYPSGPTMARRPPIKRGTP